MMIDPAYRLLLTTLMLTQPGGAAHELRRRADWGFRLVLQGEVATARDVRSGSAAERAGLTDGDRVLEIDGIATTDRDSIAALRRSRRGGDRVRLRVSRDGGTRDLDLTLPALSEERIPGCEVRYGSLLTSRGDRVRTVFTRPSGARGRLPTLVFIPWLSCDPVEGPDPGDGWMRLLRGLAERSGWALYRVEKPGVGDSEGSDCSHNDLEADLAAFRAALNEVRSLDAVDRDHIVIFGGSIGAALAPILARGRSVAGVIVSGGFSRTWLEHMLEIERRRLALEGTPVAEIHRAMIGFADFYSLYLNGRLTPAQVLARRPDLAPLWHDAPDGQYGRPAAYYHQVQSLDVESAWAALDVPVLILHGEHDWIMSRAEAEHIVEIVDARHPGFASLAVLPGTDHNLMVHRSAIDAYRGPDGDFDTALVDRVVHWLRERTSSDPARAR